jgi:type VI secretion system protein ImpG
MIRQSDQIPKFLHLDFGNLILITKPFNPCRSAFPFALSKRMLQSVLTQYSRFYSFTHLYLHQCCKKSFQSAVTAGLRMEFRHYFENELLTLRELGREAARRNPALAPFFNTPGSDPDVERLLEGFAFLSGRLRQKLDDELPEITHGLFSKLWPNYLRPLPAASVIQYQSANNSTSSTLVPKGTLLKSVPVEGTPCTFQTVYDTQILPIRIAEQQFLQRNGEETLAVRFVLTNGSLSTLPLSQLRFFFTGKETTAYSLYFTLCQCVKELRFVVRDENREEHSTMELEPSAIRPVGFLQQEGLYPYPETTALGYRILQEYFCFPEKFLFVEVSGLEGAVSKQKLHNFQDLKEFELHFVLREVPKECASFRADNWQLFCTPVVNLFPLQATPLTLADPGHAFRVIPVPEHPEHFSVYSVERVSSWAHGGKGQVVYANSISFDHPFSESLLPTYRQDIRPSLDGEDVETYISLNAGSTAPISVGLELTCTNRMLPRQLGLGDICLSADSEKASALSCKNILPVVSPLPPPLHDDLLWQLLSTMSLNYIILTDISAFKATLATYNFRAMHDHECARAMKKIFQGITSIQSRETDRIFKGMPVRGAQTRVTLDQACFSCEGALYLFGAVLNAFLALYATVNSFQQTIIIGEQGKEYRWPARLGGSLGA